MDSLDQQSRGGASAPPRRVLILGVGNLLLQDDGFGVHFINSLTDTVFPEHVTVLEAGTVSHHLLPLLREMDHLIVVDTVEAGDVPGSLFRFSPDDLTFSSGPKASLHQMSLIDVLQMVAMTGKKPRTVIIGVQPKSTTTWSLELSDELKAVLPRVRELVFEELRKIDALPEAVGRS